MQKQNEIGLQKQDWVIKMIKRNKTKMEKETACPSVSHADGSQLLSKTKIIFSDKKKHTNLCFWLWSRGRPSKSILKEADLKKIIMHSHVFLLIFTNFNESKN